MSSNKSMHRCSDCGSSAIVEGICLGCLARGAECLVCGAPFLEEPDARGRLSLWAQLPMVFASEIERLFSWDHLCGKCAPKDPASPPCPRTPTEHHPDALVAAGHIASATAAGDGARGSRGKERPSHGCPGYGDEYTRWGHGAYRGGVGLAGASPQALHHPGSA